MLITVHFFFYLTTFEPVPVTYVHSYKSLYPTILERNL